MTVLHESVQSIETLLSLLDNGVVIHAADGSVSECNETAVRILGRGSSDLLGSPTLFPRLAPMRDDGAPLEVEDEPSRIALRRGEISCASVAFQRSGDMAWIEVSSAPLLDPQTGRICGALSVILDRTAQKLIQGRFGGAPQLEALGRLAGEVAHDFNNLLTTILSSSEILMRGLDAADPRRREAEIQCDAARRAARLTRQLLAFSRQQPLELESLDPGAVVAAFEGILVRLVGEDIALRVSVESDLPRIRADRTQLEQVLMNLAANARDAMRAGGTLRISAMAATLGRIFEATHPGSQAGRYVRISMADDGEGMTPEVQAHIFEPFFTTKPPERGTGLGLAIAYGIVKQSGGYIDVTSAPGRGSTFDVYLPVEGDPGSSAS